MSGEVPGASAGLHPFLPTSSPHLPKLFSEENLTLILFAYSFKIEGLSHTHCDCSGEALQRVRHHSDEFFIFTQRPIDS